METHPENPDYSEEIEQMIRVLRMYQLTDERILDVMRKVPRHRFIPESHLKRDDPYGNHPCYIGYGQTISQPFIVAYMTLKIDPCQGENILEIGAGSGYQAAVLAEFGADITSIEIIPELAVHAESVIRSIGYTNIRIINHNGYLGHAEHAPYDKIIVTCAPETVPERLKDQLKEGGKLIVPVGDFSQQILIINKRDGKFETERDIGVRFVPMVDPI